MQNDGDFVGVILLYKAIIRYLKIYCCVIYNFLSIFFKYKHMMVAL
jgi:hypothetical protein